MSATSTVGSAVVREWQRFTPLQRLERFAVYLAVVAAVVVSARTVEIIPEFLYDAPAQMADLLERMWPVDTAHYRTGVHAALMETLHIATLGTLLGSALGASEPLWGWLDRL